MDTTLFYAWQDDRDRQTNRYLIRDALGKALKALRPAGGLVDSPRLDHDTKDRAGTPEIAGTIFSKIDTCAVFVADPTFVGVAAGAEEGRHENHSATPSGKLLPNPNVLLELGYAAGRIGWERIICVMNEFYGPAERQIFDIRHRRWPICYHLSPEAAEHGAKARADVAQRLQEAIAQALAAEHQAAIDVARMLAPYCLQILRTNARNDFFRLGKRDTMGLVLANQQHDSAFTRLISLGIVYCSHNHPE